MRSKAVSSVLALPLLPWLGACVVAVSANVEIDEPVDAVDITLGVGDLTVQAEPGNVVLEAELGGLSDSELDYEVVDRELVVDASCGDQALCGGQLDVTMPARTGLTARVGTGSVDVDGLSGPLFLTCNAGSIDGRALASDQATVEVDVGDVGLRFRQRPTDLAATVATGNVTITVPSGAYDLRLEADRGSIDTRGVSADPAASEVISVSVGTGNIDIIGL